MDELKYDFLTEVQGRGQAEVLKAFLVGNGMEDVELFQESLGQSIYPTTLDILGNVQIYVPKEQLTLARKLLDEYFNPPSVEADEKPKVVRKPVKKTATTTQKTRTKTAPRKSK